MTTRALRAIIQLVAALSVAWPALAQSGPFGGGRREQPAEPVTFRVVAQKSAVVPGDQLAIAVVFDLADGWHIWPSAPRVPASWGLEPIATQVLVAERPAAVSWVGPTQWPEPHDVETSVGGPPAKIPLHEGRVIIYLPIAIAADAAPGKADIRLALTYQACDDTTCLAPEDVEVVVPLEVVAQAGASTAAGPDAAIFQGFDLATFANIGRRAPESVSFNVFGRTFSVDAGSVVGVAALLLLAALGGLLLNLTPCVLPVIPIKMMGLSHAAGNPARALRLGLTMCAGVIAFWLALGGAIATIKGFDAINQLFQQAWFSIAVGLFIAVMGVGMLGVFTIGLPKFVYMVDPRRETLGGSFVFGIMTAVLSTPCTAPFMGAAAAWATKQPALLTMATFASIGAGMALPYLILAANPRLVSKVPRTGPASELVKQVMGLLMLAVASWFTGIGVSAMLVEPPDSPGRGYWYFVAAFGVAAMGWMVFRTFRITRAATPRAVIASLGAALTAITLFFTAGATAKGPINWTAYTPERFAAAISRGDVVVIDFTAEWCLNCKALESGVLHRREVASALNSPGVAALKVDLTTTNPAGKALLKELDWVGIPLLAVYGPGLEAPPGEPLKFDSYTPGVVLDAIERARRRP